ncbi:hypothetical protein IT575_02230 [bacterium]|nr:hypothetical protein [bacterium]
MPRLRFPWLMLGITALASLALVMGALSLLAGQRGVRMDLSSGRIESYLELYGREVFKAQKPSPLHETYLRYSQGAPAAAANWLLLEWQPLLPGGIQAAHAAAAPAPGLRETLVPVAAEELARCVDSRSTRFRIPRGQDLSIEGRRELLSRGMQLLADREDWVHFPGFMADVERRLKNARLPASELDLPTVAQYLLPQTSGQNFPAYQAPPASGDMKALLWQLEQQYRNLQQEMGYRPLPGPGNRLYRDPSSGIWQELQGWEQFSPEGLILPDDRSDGPAPGVSYAF